MGRLHQPLQLQQQQQQQSHSGAAAIPLLNTPEPTRKNKKTTTIKACGITASTDIMDISTTTPDTTTGAVIQPGDNDNKKNVNDNDIEIQKAWHEFKKKNDDSSNSSEWKVAL